MGTFDDERRHAARPVGDRAPSGPATDAPADAHARRILQLQRQAGNAGVAQLLGDTDEGVAVEQVLSRGGDPLDRSTRAQMESAFGECFADVRVHTGTEASASAQRLGANAYTVGTDVVFSDGHYDPASTTGQRTLAHELTHVVQQRSGPVDGVDTGAGVKVSEPGDRFERAAEATAERVASGEQADVGATGAASVQREAGAEDELEETAQALWVQREEMAEDEVPDQA